MLINPVDLLLWTFRRNENDVVKLYDALSPIMEVSTGGDMLNFGFWDETTLHPVDAQKRLCEMMGDMAQISSAEITFQPPHVLLPTWSPNALIFI